MKRGVQKGAGYKNYTITLASFNKLFKPADKSVAVFEQELLGDEVYFALFSLDECDNGRNLKGKADSKNLVSDSSASKIRSCSDSSAFGHYNRVYRTLFMENEGEKGRILFNDLVDKFRILMTEQQENEYFQKLTEYLQDPFWNMIRQYPISESEHIYSDMKKYLTDVRNRRESEQLPFSFALVLILAITREERPRRELPAWLMPEGVIDDTAFQKLINNLAPYMNQVKSALDDGSYADAINTLKIIIKEVQGFENKEGIFLSEYEDSDKDISIDSRENQDLLNSTGYERLYRNPAAKTIFAYKASIYYLVSQGYTGLWNSASKPSHRAFYAEKVRNALDLSANTYHGVEARLVIAKHFCLEKDEELCPDNERIFPYDINECVTQCQKLLAEHPSAAKECGEVYWILYNLSEKNLWILPYGESSDDYLKKASDFGYKEAFHVYNTKYTVSLIKKADVSADHSEGEYYLNDINVYAEYIDKTHPERWKELSYTRDKYGNIMEDWSVSQSEQKHFLISDDEKKNLKDLLYLLETLKSGYDKIQNPYRRLEFYVRGDEEKLAPFIDTAMSRMKDMVFPVYILDDHKRAARLLARHPLFYPIRHLSHDEKGVLTMVIIGETKRCEWLLREAFWMMTFLDPNICTNIQVISPSAAHMVEKVLTLCPGMNPAVYKGSEGSLPVIYAQECAYDSQNMLQAIQESIVKGKVYITIDIGDDLDNSSMAIELREYTIKQWASTAANRIQTTPEFPIIAFHCLSPDIANLSYKTVVLNEENGSRWFNNYAIIPFGRLDQQYSWDSLTQDIFEVLSLNVHLHYYFDSNVGTDLAFDENTYKNALKDYYRRTYNRDSSMGVAMSLPYRLFQGIDTSDQSAGGESICTIQPVLPEEPIDILNPDSFYSEKAIAHYLTVWEKYSDWRKTQTKNTESGNTINVKPSKESFLYVISRWEHERWNRWMISRKWTGIKNRETVNVYYHEGNQRQQLYIGRIHALIDSYDEVERFGDYWKKLTKQRKDFCQNDISAIQKTGEILRRQWTQKAKNYYRDVAGKQQQPQQNLK